MEYSPNSAVIHSWTDTSWSAGTGHREEELNNRIGHVEQMLCGTTSPLIIHICEPNSILLKTASARKVP